MWVDKGELEKVQQLVEGWDDQLPDDLKKYGPKLREVAVRIDSEDDVQVSRFSLVNALINGVLDRVM